MPFWINEELKIAVELRHKETGGIISGLSPLISIYDPGNAIVIRDQRMIEVGTTAIYTYSYIAQVEGYHIFICNPRDVRVLRVSGMVRVEKEKLNIVKTFGDRSRIY